MRLLPKIWRFLGQKIVHLFVRFLTKLGAPLSSELLDTLDNKDQQCTCTEILIFLYLPRNPALGGVHKLREQSGGGEGLKISKNCSRYKSKFVFT